MIIPERCVKDLVDVSEQAKREMEIVAVSKMDEILPLALAEVPKALEGKLKLAPEPVPGNIPEIKKRKRIKRSDVVADAPN